MSLGPGGSSVLLTLAGAGRTVFRADEAPGLVGLSREVTRDRLKTLEHHGWVKRLARGLYLVIPLEAGPQRSWTEDPAIIASQLVRPSYISFWSALHFHGLTEQVPAVVTVATRRSHAPMDILGLRYLFTALSARKFFGFEPSWVGHQQVSMATPEKAILDSLDHPERAGGVSEVAKAIVSRGEKLDGQRLLQNLLRMEAGAVAKRLGFLLEILDVGTSLLTAVKAELRTGYSLLDPSLPARGHYLSRWKLRLNVSVDEILSGIGT